MVQTVAVDFDKVIHTYDKGWHDGTIYGDLMPGAAGGLHKLMQTCAVFVHTTREPLPVAVWIQEKTGIVTVCEVNSDLEFWNDLGRILVTNRKLPAIAYIDDRGIRFENWTQALNDLETYEGVLS